MAVVYTNVKNNIGIFTEDHTLDLVSFITGKNLKDFNTTYNSSFAKQELMEALGI